MKRIQTNSKWLRKSFRKTKVNICINKKTTTIFKKQWQTEKLLYHICAFFLCANKKGMPKMWVYFCIFFRFLWLALWVQHVSECIWINICTIFYANRWPAHFDCASKLVQLVYSKWMHTSVTSCWKNLLLVLFQTKLALFCSSIFLNNHDIS